MCRFKKGGRLNLRGAQLTDNLLTSPLVHTCARAHTLTQNPNILFFIILSKISKVLANPKPAVPRVATGGRLITARRNDSAVE